MRTNHKLRILAVLLFLPVLGTLSLAENLMSQSNWMIALGGDNYDKFNSTVEWMGDFYFGGYKDDVGVGAPNAWLLSTDLDGNILVDKAWTDDVLVGAEIKKLVVGDVFYAGGIVGNLDSGYDLFVMALSSDGDILWQKQLQDEGDEILGDMILTADGSLLLVGVNRPEGEYVGEGWVVKMDTSGNVIWQKSFGSRGVDYLRAAIDRPGGGYVVAGEVGIPGSNDFYQGWIMALNTDGSLIWQKAFLISNSDGINALVNVGNQILGLGSALQLAYFRGDAWILRVDSNGNYLSSHLIGDFDGLQHDEFVDGIITQGGDLVTLGNTVSIGGGVSEQIWAALIDRRGQVKGVRHYGGGNVDTATELLYLGADGFVFTGWTQWSPRLYDGYIIKVDKKGDGLIDCDRVHTLQSELRPGDPEVSVPDITEEVTTARIVDGNLTEQITDTYSDILCAD
jgi:hypothetical protein